MKLLNIQCLTFCISPVVYYLTLILNCYSSEPELHTLWAPTRSRPKSTVSTNHRSKVFGKIKCIYIKHQQPFFDIVS